MQEPTLTGKMYKAIWDEQFIIDSEAGGLAATCEDGALLPFIVLTAACMARSVQLFLRAKKKVGFSISPAGSVAV